MKDLESYFKGVYDTLRVLRAWVVIKDALWVTCIFTCLYGMCLNIRMLDELKKANEHVERTTINVEQLARDIGSIHDKLNGDEGGNLNGAFSK